MKLDRSSHHHLLPLDRSNTPDHDDVAIRRLTRYMQEMAEDHDNTSDTPHLVAAIVAQVTSPDAMRATARLLITEAAERAAIYADAVRPIWGAKDNGLPDHIGSCVLIEIGLEKFILTAGHVVDWAAQTNLYIGLDKLEPLLDAFETSPIPTGGRDHDVIDYAIMRFPTHLLSNLGNAIFIPEAAIGLGDPLEKRYFTCIGFPNSKNRTPQRNATAVPGKRRSYTSRGRSTTKLPGRAEAGVHVLVDHNAKFSRASDGTRVNSGKPNGVSGGAIFDVGALGTLDQLLRPEPARLAALFIEAHRKQHVVMGTRIDRLLAILRGKGWL